MFKKFKNNIEELLTRLWKWFYTRFEQRIQQKKQTDLSFLTFKVNIFSFIINEFKLCTFNSF